MPHGSAQDVRDEVLERCRILGKNGGYICTTAHYLQADTPLVNILVGSFFIAVAGSFYVIHYHAAIPSVFSFTAGVNTIAYLFIGGFTHSLAGPILGAFIVTFIPEYLQFAQTLRPIIIAAVVIFILMFLPAGLLGLWDNKIKPRFAAKPPERRD